MVVVVISTFLGDHGWIVAPDIEGMRSCILTDNGTPFWAVINFVNLAVLHFENEKNNTPDNETQSRK